MRARRRSGDEGAALVLALAFMTAFGLFVTALLGFADASFRTTDSLRFQRATLFAADAGIEAAIQNMRGRLLVGRYLLPCPNFTLPGVNGYTTTVTCVPEAGSGLPISSTPASVPLNAILTTATDSSVEDGIRSASNKTVRVEGTVISNSNIAVTNPSGQLAVNGEVYARGACTGNVTDSTIPVACGLGAAPIVGSSDPDYQPLVTTAPATRAVPACNAANNVVTFTPGTYDDAAALNAIMNLSPSCDDDIFWFQPGVYYFDFQNSGTHVWSWGSASKDVRIVGGQPKDWTPSSATTPVVPYPGGCKTETDGATDGVQFIFGGDSQISIGKGSVELCPKPSVTDQQISVYGMKTDSPPTTVQLKPKAATNVVRFTNTSNAFEIGESPLPLTSDATMDSLNTSASLRLTGFDQATIPAGATITDVSLKVAHSETLPSQVAALTVTVNPGVGAAIVRNPTKTAILTTDSFDLTSALTTPAHFTGLTVDYLATHASGIPIESLDGIRLDVSYRIPPILNKQSGCVITAGGCSMISTSGQGKFLSHGTIYAPAAKVSFAHQNFNESIARRGIVSRVVDFNVTPNPENVTPLVDLPPLVPTVADRTVILTASVAGEARVRALVRFGDLEGVIPGSQVEIVRWGVLR